MSPSPTVANTVTVKYNAVVVSSGRVKAVGSPSEIEDRPGQDDQVQRDQDRHGAHGTDDRVWRSDDRRYLQRGDRREDAERYDQPRDIGTLSGALGRHQEVRRE